MDAIAKIKDDHKRAFAYGFKFLFEQQDEMHQSEVANAASVPPAAITNIIHGYEERFPGFKAQIKISKVFHTDVYSIVKLGHKIQAGFKFNTASYNVFLDQEPEHSNPDYQEFVDHFNLDCLNKGLNKLPAYERQILRLFRSFKGDRELVQNLYDFTCNLFISYQIRILKKLEKN